MRCHVVSIRYLPTQEQVHVISGLRLDEVSAIMLAEDLNTLFAGVLFDYGNNLVAVAVPFGPSNG